MKSFHNDFFNFRQQKKNYKFQYCQRNQVKKRVSFKMQNDPDFQQQKQEGKEIKEIYQDYLLCHDSNKDFLQKCEIVFDHVKLLTFLSQEEIQHLDDTLNDKKDNAPRGFLESVPIQALPAVHQYLGKQYRCLHPSIKQSYEIQKYKFKDVSYLNGMTFPNLVILNLSSQLIQNLQALAFISAPQLKALQLYDNKICNMNALVKADFPHLEAITFYLNPIRKMEQFYRFHAKKLKTYEFDNVKQATCPYQDYRFLFKREDTIPLKIKVQNRFRINMKKKPYFTALNQPGTNILFYDKRRYRNGVRILRS